MSMMQIFFNTGNIFVLPFWILMIFFPNWEITKRVMKSLLCFVPLGLLYLYLYIDLLSPEFLKSLLNPQLAYITDVCTNHSVMGWVHFLAVDLFAGRWIYWAGQNTGIWITHSLLLQFFAGPLGILSHFCTSSIAQKCFGFDTQISDTSI